MEEQTVHLIPKPSLLKIISVIVLVFLASAIYFRFVGPIPFSITSTVSNKTDLFTVSGEGKVSVIPDIANITLGITSHQNTISNAQKEVNSVMNKIQDDLKTLKIDDKDVQTANYSINPTYDWSSGKGKITGYEVSSNLNVKVRNFENINPVIDQATVDGANLVNNLSFTVDDDKLKILQTKAREEAVKDAKSKAEELARVSGIKLGKIVNVQESFVPPTVRINMLDSKIALGSDQASTSITPGQQDVTTSITLSYETY